MKISKIVIGLIAVAAIGLFSPNIVNAQQHMMQDSKQYWRNHYSSDVHIGGSSGSWSGYNNHQNHNFVSSRKYYTYEGNDYYIDLNTGIRYRFGG